MTTPNKTNRSIPLPTWYSVSVCNDDGTVSSMGDSIFGYGKTKRVNSNFDDDIEVSSVGTMSVMEESQDGGSLTASSNHWYFLRKNKGEKASSNVDTPTTKVEHTQDSEEVTAQGSLEQPKLQADVDPSPENNVESDVGSSQVGARKTMPNEHPNDEQLVTAVDPNSKHNPSWFAMNDGEDAETGSLSASSFGNSEKAKACHSRRCLLLFAFIGIAAISGGIAALVSSKKQQVKRGGEQEDPSIVQVTSPPSLTPPSVVLSTPIPPPPSPTTGMTTPSSSGTMTLTKEPTGPAMATTDPPSATPAPVAALPTFAPMDLTLYEKIELLSPESFPALENATTPQARALQWALAQPTPSLEHYSLATLYFSSMNENWINNTEWLASSNVCQWNGITCNGDNVTQIDLSYTYLVSTLPDEISLLTDLQALSIPGGELTGTIPASYGERLTNLEQIVLEWNNLGGPLNEIGALTKLSTLDVSYNDFSAIPTEFGLLTNLVHLKVSENEITGPLPSELGNIKTLTELQAQDNELMGSIPTELFSLENLSWLDVSKNELGGVLPHSIGGLSSVETLVLHHNSFVGTIPESLVLLSNLRELDLSDNDLSGTIPSELGGWSNIVSLNLEKNSLNGRMPDEICGIESLEKLKYSKNCTICQCCNGHCQNMN